MNRCTAATVGYPFLLMLIAVSPFKYTGKIAIGILLLIVGAVVLAITRMTARRLTAITAAVLAASAACFIFAFAEYGNVRGLESKADTSAHICGTVVSEPRYTDRYEYVIRADDGTRFVFVSNELSDGRLYDRFEGNVVFYSRTSVADKAYMYAYAENGRPCRFECGGKKGINSVLSAVREWSEKQIDSIADGKTAAFLKGVTLGNSTEAGQSLSRSFRAAGLAHVLVVSGAHLTTVLTVITVVFTAGHGRKRRYFACSLLLMLAYMAVTGFGASVVRAGACSAVLWLSYLSARDADPVNSLGAAALFVGIIDPYIAVSIGFQLSFFSSFGIVTLGFWLSRKTDNLSLFVPLKKLLKAVIVTVSAQLFTLPVMITAFSEISAVSVISNLLTYWAVGLTITCAVIYLLLCAMFAYPIAMPFGFASALCAKYCVAVAEGMASLPLAYVKLPQTVCTVCVAIIAAAAAICVISRRKPVKIITAAVIFAAVAVACTATVYYSGCIRITSVTEGCVMISRKGDAVVVGCGDSVHDARRLIMSAADSRLNRVSLIAADDEQNGALITAVQGMEVSAVMAGESDRLDRACGETTEILPSNGTALPFDGCTVIQNSQYTSVEIDGVRIIIPKKGAAAVGMKDADILLCTDGVIGSAKTAVIYKDAKPLALYAQKVYNANTDSFTLWVSKSGRILSVN